ncbi:uncharacterized protein (TIGR03083 family) [Allocatelliglobosispora scoriae]|uniref:Uncharacterized protein (TIGR03083 family) n=1 Tax=Allocatelliglobosispora scoriae TaxID=643052 RepID=A0A841BWJ3_9ACTN|nr:maleylpyruvate isomerase family mycothiol-dependent enzyme [Allocatelliglobosispora scoriae]MBB5872524.1 uncharacterized protein (TIGR03083 family) [Allocatelliglobosispora scoriae]
MEIADHIAALRRDGLLLADAAAMHTLDEAVPTTPGWTVGDLLRHIGEVHRWAMSHVAQQRLTKMPTEEEQELTRNWPEGDDELLEWFSSGHEALVFSLETADPGLRCWTFLPAPSPLAFWARRQAHETAIHRVDAESVTGEITPIGAEFAADGVDELLTCFFGRPGRLRGDPAYTLGLVATDLPRAWRVSVGPTVVVTDGGEAADCVVTGTAEELYLLLWNRRDPAGLDVVGDEAVLTRWRDSAVVSWS